MGLSRELEGLKKQQQKQEQSEVRSSSTVLVLALALVGCGVFIAYSDEQIAFKIQIKRLKLLLGLFTLKKERTEFLKKAFEEIQRF